MRMLLPLVFGLVGLAGCSSDGVIQLAGGTQGAGGAGGSSGTGLGGGGGGGVGPASFTVTFDPVTVAPGMENTQCIVKKVGNEELIRVHQIHNVLPTGSHHLIVYRTNDTVEQLTPFDCQPFADTLDPSKGAPVMITQKHDDTLTLPDGVAFSMQPGQMVRLEMHYINASPKPLDISATTTFTTMSEADFKDEADFLFIGNPDIKIPAHSTATLGPTYIALPNELAGVNFFGITGHTHQWGKNVTVATTDSKAGMDKPVYDEPNWLWSEPPTVYHDPPFTIPQGGGFRFTCSWDNQSSAQVGFGESANQEMCFFWAYYYPSKGALVCAHTDQIPGGLDVCCPGNALCSQLF
jgi:Copper type II ascorbate-dependent monooxygenase, C-terminal domain